MRRQTNGGALPSPRATGREGPITSPAAAENKLYVFSFLFLALVIIFIGLFTEADRYADFDPYVYYLNELVNFPPDGWYLSDPLSKLFLLFAYGVTGSVYSAVVLSHYLLGAIFLMLLVFAAPPSRANWQALIFLFAIFGPLLAFVAIRATPAYLFIAIAAYSAIEKRPITWLYFMIATLFHTSTLLAFAPLLMVYFQKNLPNWLKSNRTLAWFLILILAAGSAAPQLGSTFSSLLQSVDNLAKFTVYVSPEREYGYEHYIFFVFMITFAGVFAVFQDGRSRGFNIYVAASVFLYVLIFFSVSPIAAVRQAPFWFIPMCTFFPWRKVGVRGFGAIIFFLICSGLFAFQFQEVY